MNLLLDTHIFLWWMSNNKSLSPGVLSAIRNPDHQVFVSAVVAWEIAIKVALGKLEAPDNLAEEIQTDGFRELPISVEHALAAGHLPKHHSDPFDRMLIAQARIENLTLITSDRLFTQYEVNILRA